MEVAVESSSMTKAYLHFYNRFKLPCKKVASLKTTKMLLCFNCLCTCLWHVNNLWFLVLCLFLLQKCQNLLYALKFLTGTWLDSVTQVHFRFWDDEA